MKTKIYHLRIADENPRYVGKTIHSLQHRLARHYKEARREKHHRAFWVAKQRTLNIPVLIELIEEVEGDGCSEERKWIAEYRALGYNLVNGTDGGEGILGYVFSEEARQKMSATHKRNVTEEQRHWGRHLGRLSWARKTPEEKAIWSARMYAAYRKKHPKPLAQPVSDEERARAQAAGRARLSAAIKKWHAGRTPAQRRATAKRARDTRRVRAAADPARYKKVPTAEQIRKLRVAIAAQWAAMTPEQKADRQARMHAGRRGPKKGDKQHE